MRMRSSFASRSAARKEQRRKEAERREEQLAPVRDLNAASAERVSRQFADARHQTRRQLDDLIELLEESLIEHGNRHSDGCDKQTSRGAPCSCGFASLLKARRLASKIEA